MRNTQRKGDIAVSQAVASFTRLGFDVSIPLTESAPYDLIVDCSEGLKRVQVKFSTEKHVDLRSIHSNSNGYQIKKSKSNDYDWLYVLRNGKEYLFKECFEERRSVTPQSKDLLEK